MGTPINAVFQVNSVTQFQINAVTQLQTAGPELLGVALVGLMLVAWLVARKVDSFEIPSPQ